MSATFYPAKRTGPKSWTYVEATPLVNVSNSSCRRILGCCCLSPEFEDHVTEMNQIDDLIHRLAVMRDFSGDDGYLRERCIDIRATMLAAKSAGATHWYAC